MSLVIEDGSLRQALAEAYQRQHLLAAIGRQAEDLVAAAANDVPTVAAVSGTEQIAAAGRSNQTGA